MPKSIPVIGLIGGIGSGKSSVARQAAQEMNIKIIDGDKIGHQVLELPEVRSQLVNEFGNHILGNLGEIDRQKLATLVFSNETSSADSLNKLEKIVHPYIEGTIASEIRQTDDQDAIILDAAVMLEAGWDRFCDRIVFVDVPKELRYQRIAQSRNWSREQWLDREANQISVEEKQTQADAIIDNSHSIDIAAKQLITVIQNDIQTQQ